jgi:hypothetical protein
VPLRNNAPPRTPGCHPERKHLARGLCKQCYDADYASRNREKVNEKNRRWVANNPGRRREVHRRNRYGVEPEHVQSLLEEQSGKCAICRTGDPENLDHNHETGQVRGLLCGRCNRALGLFCEDAERMLSAIVYLQAWADAADGAE